MSAHRVVIAYKSFPAYRREFYDSLRTALGRDGVVLDFVHGEPEGVEQLKRDTTELPWAISRPNRSVSISGRQLLWQPIGDVLDGADLVIVEQASKLLLNYWLLVKQALRRGPKVALWGHGANLQPSTVSRVAESLKRRYSRLPHWWFAYTEGCKDRVAALGYPPERITVVQNAIDTVALRNAITGIPASDLNAFRRDLGCTAGSTGLFIGSLYEDKRLGFLLRAATVIRRSHPNFVLLIAGDGPQRELAQAAHERHPFVRYLGRVDGPTRHLALRSADVVLMPSAVGLCILDAFAAEAPLVTTVADSHGPEIEYLRPGDNGLIVSDPEDVESYAAGALSILEQPSFASHLRAGCRQDAERFTNEAMVARFHRGVSRALLAT